MSNQPDKKCLDRLRTVLTETQSISFDLIKSKTIDRSSENIVYNIHQKAHDILRRVDVYF